MSIIEKLGIKTPDKLETVGDVYKVFKIAGLSKPHISDYLFFEQGHCLKKIIDDKNEMLEALIEFVINYEEFFDDSEECEMTQKDIKIIEKATGKTWDEIKKSLCKCGEEND